MWVRFSAGEFSISGCVDAGSAARNSLTNRARKNFATGARNIQSVWVKEFEAVVENDMVTQYWVNLKLSFLIEGAGAGAG